MTPEYQLIQQISQLVENSQLDNRALLEEYAVQFSELCRQANDRLMRCNDYLDKGRRSEAVYEAHLPPDLLQLSSTLESFTGLNRWKNICQDLELEVFQPLNNTIISRLREASGSEAELEPLLKEYRRCVYQSDHAQCVVLLRRIRERDPQNPSWIENLRPLEEEFLPTWIERAEKGLAEMDMAELKAVFKELNHPMRVVKAPDELMARLRKALLSERAVDLRADAKRLMIQLKEAMEEEDISQMESLWAKCAALEADEAFIDRPAGWDKVIADSHELADELERRKQKEGEFKQAVSRLKDMLMENTASALELRHEYERLQSMGMPIPEMLTRQVREVLEQKQAAKRRRATVIGMSVASAVVVCAVLALVAVHLIRRNERRNEWRAQAELFAGKGASVELETLMEEVKENDSDLYASPEFVGYRNDMAEKKRVQEKKESEFLAIKATLEKIRKNDYRGESASILRMLDDAAAVATGDEQKEYVSRWKNDWSRFTSASEQEADDKLTPVLNGIMASLAGVKTASEDRIADELKALESVRKDFDQKLKPEAIQACSQEVRTRCEQLRSAIEARVADATTRSNAWQKELQRRKEEQEQLDSRLATLRKDIAAALPDMERYQALLKRFVDEGAKAREASDYRLLLSQFADYRGVLSIQTLNVDDTPVGKEIMAQAQKLLAADNPAASSVWRSDLERLVALNRMNTELQRKVGTLLNLREGNVYVFKCRRYGDEQWSYFYGERPFQSQQKDGVVYYWGTIQWASPQESRTTPMTLAEWNGGNNITSADFEVIYSRVKEDNLAEHVKVMRRLVAEAMRNADVPSYVLSELQKLRGNSELDPVQGMLIVKKFMTLMASYCGDELPECREWAAQAKDIDTNIPWQNSSHPKTVLARQKIAAFWRGIPDLEPFSARLQWNRRLLAAVLGARLRCVGSVQLSADGRKVFIPRSRGTEYWLFLPGGQGSLPGFKLLHVDEKGNVNQDELTACTTGCPIFSASQGREVKTLWRRFAEENPERLKSLVRPQALPVNID